MTAAAVVLLALVSSIQAQPGGDRYAEAMALYQLGTRQVGGGDERGFASLQSALASFREQQNEYGQMLCLTSLGDAYDRRQDKAAALASYEEGLRLGEAVDDSKAVSFYRMKSGLILASTGRLERALDDFTRARAIYVRDKDRVQEIRAVNNIGTVLKLLGDHRRALSFAEEALSLSRAAGIEEGQGTILVHIGDLHRALGEHDQARRSYTEAIEKARRQRSVPEQAFGLDSLATLDVMQGRFASALQATEQARELWRLRPDSQDESESLHVMGQSLRGLGRYDAALQVLDEAARIRQRFHARHRLSETRLEMALVERDRGRLAGALAQVKASLEMVEALRSEVTDPDLRASFAASRMDVYAVYIDILMRLHQAEPTAGHDSEALRVSERARARVLLEALIEARADVRTGADAAVLESERAAQKRLSQASERLAALSGRGGADAAAARDEFDARARELREVQSRIRQTSPRYAALTQPEPPSLDDIRRRLLDEGTVLLEFSVGLDRSYVWAVTTDELIAQPLPGAARIESAARALMAALTERQRRVTAAALGVSDARASQEAQRLGQLLLGGLAPRLEAEWKGKRLLIVPSGALAYVPFGVLSTPAASSRVLAADHEIVYAPSAAVLLALRGETAPAPAVSESVAVLADPVFEASDPRVRGEREDPAEAPATSALSRAAASLGRTGFARLPFSRREADWIASEVPPEALLRATDFKASRALVAGGALDQRQVIHFATHGVLETEHPDLSGLVLSLVDEQGRSRDGFLRMPEVYNLHLSARVVVLSACQTALGREVRGEGLMGLTRGFLYAGARAVVASLWQVDDESTAELMKRFYRGMLKEKRRPADALRLAQLEMSRDKRWSAPFYWAGFVLQGEWR